MSTPGWLLSEAAELPLDHDWLSAREREVLDALRVEKRRRDWLLGRWAAKRALEAWLGAPPGRLEVIAAADGVPEAFLDGSPAGAALSISHRGGRAMAAVGAEGTALGCDLELLEPRTPAFVREWLASSERELVENAGPERAILLANLIWCAKEAAAKARRGGLRLNVRRAVVSQRDGARDDRWHPLSVRWPEDDADAGGWWRQEPGWVMALVAEPAVGAPRRL